MPPYASLTSVRRVHAGPRFEVVRATLDGRDALRAAKPAFRDGRATLDSP
jgi:hypothetical protein